MEKKSIHMNEEFLFGMIRSIIVANFSVEEEDVTREASFGADLEIYSLELVETVMSIEDVFDIRISEKEIEALITVKDLIELVAKKKEGVQNAITSRALRGW